MNPSENIVLTDPKNNIINIKINGMAIEPIFNPLI